jgi:cytosolic carboxypeptidase protein 2/3
MKIQLFCDMHGHNRKLGAFFYGNTFLNYEQDGRAKNSLIRILPMLCSQKDERFMLKSCRFHMIGDKEGTARQTIFKELCVNHTYTLEASYFGYENSDGQVIQFQANDYEDLGRTLIRVFSKYLPRKQRRLLRIVESVMRSLDLPKQVSESISSL